LAKVLADLVELSGYLHLDGFYGLFGGDDVFDFHEDVLDLHVGLFVHVLGWWLGWLVLYVFKLL